MLALAFASAAGAQDVPIVQPGAPGEDARALTADEAIDIARNSYSPDDVTFMQDMIIHHQQAVDMAALVADRTNTQEIVDLAGRIDASQADEIAFMQGWLTERGETAPDPTEHGHMHMDHDMAGMATPEQMAALAAASGTDFDRLFLELMIAHHEGAVTMVNDLRGQPGSAYDPVLFEFINDIVSDQNAEIERMDGLLASLSDDARVGLAAGFRDAGEAISNLTLVASLPKPPGFFDPANPANIPPVVPRGEDEDDAASEEEDAAHEGHEGHGDHAGHAEAMGDTPSDMAMDAAPEDEREDEQSNEDTEWGSRSPLLSFSQTDMAFQDDVLFVGNYHGFNIYRLDDVGAPQHLSSVVCPGGQGDVSVVGDLLIMSVEQTRGRVDCGRQGVSEDVSTDRFRGLRIFDVSDLTRPVQVGQVQTCRGSHTHSVVSGPDEDGKIIVYNSGTSSVRDEEELEGCIGSLPGDERTALFRIDVIEIPVDNPGAARIIDSPAVFADPETGRLAGLWPGGDHGEDTQRSSVTDECHDITTFPDAGIAGGACSGNGILFDISDPMNPTRIDEVVDTGFAYWHSATFNNDGTKVLFTDEWGGGSRPRCRASDPKDWGANAIYDIVDGELVFQSYFKIDAPQTDKENCVAHNGSIIPVPGRDVFVQSWYQGGISVIDFTDSANPFEIGYFDRGPIHPDVMILGGFWSSYWYDGKIYGTEIVRGLDVLALEPSEFLTENEIAAAKLADQGRVFNPQQQFQVTWPDEPVVALAYLDQMERDDAMSEAMIEEARTAVSEASLVLDANDRSRGLARDLDGLARQIDRRVDGARAEALAETMEGLADRLR